MSYMGVANGVIGAIGAIAKGQQQADAYSYDANVQETYAKEQLQQGKMAAAIDARKAYLLRGTILANQGGSGGTNNGSALDVLADQMSQGMLQEQGDIYSSQIEANKYRNSEEADYYNAKEARDASYFNAATSLLSMGMSQGMSPAAAGTGSGDSSNMDQKPNSGAGTDTYDPALNYVGVGYGP